MTEVLHRVVHPRMPVSGEFVPTNGGGLAASGGLTAFTEAWLANRRLSEHTRAAYRRDVAAFLSWCASRHVDPLRGGRARGGRAAAAAGWAGGRARAAPAPPGAPGAAARPAPGRGPGGAGRRGAAAPPPGRPPRAGGGGAGPRGRRGGGGGGRS